MVKFCEVFYPGNVSRSYANGLIFKIFYSGNVSRFYGNCYLKVVVCFKVMSVCLTYILSDMSEICVNSSMTF